MRYFNMRGIYLIIPFLLFAFNSCTKHVAGPKGEPGIDGKKGNLKKTERTITVSASSWVSTGWYNTKVYCPEITNDVLKKGDVEVYMKIGTQWWSLPYGVEDIFMRQSIEFEYLNLEYCKIHGVPPTPPGDRTFRIVTFSPV